MTRDALAAVVAFAVFGAAPLPHAAAAAARASPPGLAETYAIVVGHNGGRPGLPALRFADDDAVRLAMLLGGLAGPAPGRVTLLTDVDGDTTRALARAQLSVPPHSSPTRSALLAAIADVGRAVASGPRRSPRILYLAYAGHGLRGRLLLKPEGAPEAAITGAELRAALAEVVRADPDIRIFLFLDACRSQSLFAERDGDTGPDFTEEVAALERRADRVSIGVLTAATSGKPAGEVGDLRAGYFSHALTSGLAGGADSDGDEVVSFGELAAFVAFNTRRLTGQLPWFDPPGGDLGASAVDHRGRLPRLLLPSSEGGRFLVEARDGPPVFAEVFKDRSRPLKLALPPGRYRLRQVVDRARSMSAIAELRPGEVLDAAKLSWTAETAGAGTRGGAAGEASESSGAEAGGAGDADDGAGGGDLAFSAAFTPEVVSTLEAGFRAGRQPPVPLASRAGTVVLAGTAGTAPLDLGGAELGLSLQARLALGRWAFAGLRLALATSSHTALPARPYQLHRHAVTVEGGPRWSPVPRLELAAFAAAGAGGTLRREAGSSSGDPLAPLAGGGAGLRLALAGRWALLVEGRWLVHWIEVDGRRRATSGPVLDLGVGWGF